MLKGVLAAVAPLFAHRVAAAADRDGQPGSVSLIARAHCLLVGLHSPPVDGFLGDWPTASEPRSIPPSAVPAVCWLPQVDASAPPFSASFVHALTAAGASLAWRRSYSADAVGETFFDNYGWTELAGLTGPTPSEHLACGVLLLGPHLTYPAHRHEAEEIYVPLSGTAQWRHGADDWHERAPGSVIHHARNEPHAMRTGRDPLLALYLWRSADLAQKSHLD